MGRQIRTTVPQASKYLIPQWTYLPEFRQKNAEYKGKQKANFDLHHHAREASEIPGQVEVWVNTGSEPVRGTVTAPTEQPRSYMVNTPSGELRRNRSQLNIVPPGTPRSTPNLSAPTSPDPPDSVSSPTPPHSPPRIMTRSRTGTEVAMPDYLRY